MTVITTRRTINMRHYPLTFEGLCQLAQDDQDEIDRLRDALREREARIIWDRGEPSNLYWHELEIEERQRWRDRAHARLVAEGLLPPE